MDGYYENIKEEADKARDEAISQRSRKLTNSDVDRVYGPPCHSDIMDGIAASHYYSDKRYQLAVKEIDAEENR